MIFEKPDPPSKRQSDLREAILHEMNSDWSKNQYDPYPDDPLLTESIINFDFDHKYI